MTAQPLTDEQYAAIRARVADLSEVRLDVESHRHAERGCRCLSCDITTGYLISVGVDCDETPDVGKTSDGGCLVDVLTYEQATAVVAAHEDRRLLLAEADRLRAELATARAQVAAAYGFADEMGDYFVAADYAQRLRDRLDSAASHR